MRLLHTFDDKIKADRLSFFLKKEGIENHCEIVTNTDWGSADYGTFKCHIWVTEEDQFPIAQRWLTEFETHPQNPIFAFPDPPPKPLKPLLEVTENLSKKVNRLNRQSILKPIAKQSVFTVCVLFTCVVLFMIGQFTAPTLDISFAKIPMIPLISPPINKILMYDYPNSYEEVDKFIRIYGLEGLQNYENLPPEGLFLLKKIVNAPVWSGFYSMASDYFTKLNYTFQINAPLFEKIRQGQIWRVFTPCLLHANIMHLFFNMLWLVYLGKIIEDRLGGFRYLIIIFLTAIASNTTQYFMSGPDFLGFSGVICGMLAFAWTRQKHAPWEGYRLAPGTFTIMFFFVMIMAGIQMLSFFLKVYYQADYFPSIANTAHIIGGITGYLLGRLNLMTIKS